MMHKNSNKQYSVIIVGGGIVGLTCALALAEHDISVALVEANKPEFDWSESEKTARVSAINVASTHILKNLSVWQNIRTEACAKLQKMHVWDNVGGAQIDFDCAAAGKNQLGSIVENREIVRVLWQRLATFENVAIYSPQKPVNIINEKNKIQLIFEDETSISAELMIGADGGNSWVRDWMNCDLQKRSYEQQALVFLIQTKNPHQQTAFQVFSNQGIIAALPLADQHQAAVVWSTKLREVDALLSKQQENIALDLMNAFELKLGNIQVISAIKSFPLVMRHAKHYVNPRMALVGDAAHTIHPLAGQGVNLGLLDAACLVQCLVEAKQKHKDLGELRALRKYERWRKAHNQAMIASMRGFKEVFSSQSPVIVQLRNMGLNSTNKMQFLKKYCMQFAMGNIVDLPVLAKSNSDPIL